MHHIKAIFFILIASSLLCSCGDGMVNEEKIKDKIPIEPVESHLTEEEKQAGENSAEPSLADRKVVRFGHVFDSNSDPRLLVSCLSKENTEFLLDFKVVEDFQHSSIENSLVPNIALPRFQILFDYENPEGEIFSGNIPIADNFVITLKKGELILDSRNEEGNGKYFHFSRDKIWIPFKSFLPNCQECPSSGVLTENEMACFQNPIDTGSDISL